MTKKISTLLVAAALVSLGCKSTEANADTKAQGQHAMAMHKGNAVHADTAQATKPGGAIAVTVGDDGFAPSHIEVDKGSSVTLRFTRTSNATCATEVVFPELNIKKDLPLNQAVDVEIPAKESRTLTFQCGMGMYKSQVVVKG